MAPSLVNFVLSDKISTFTAAIDYVHVNGGVKEEVQDSDGCVYLILRCGEILRFESEYDSGYSEWTSGEGLQPPTVKLFVPKSPNGKAETILSSGAVQ